MFVRRVQQTLCWTRFVKREKKQINTVVVCGIKTHSHIWIGGGMGILPTQPCGAVVESKRLLTWGVDVAAVSLPVCVTVAAVAIHLIDASTIFTAVRRTVINIHIAGRTGPSIITIA